LQSHFFLVFNHRFILQFKTFSIMVTLFKKSRIGLVALGAIALMAIAGWQFGSNGTQEEFSGKEVALENAIAGSGGGWICCQTKYQSWCTDWLGNAWSYSRKITGATTCTGHE
jgi:hypothetical protein